MLRSEILEVVDNLDRAVDSARQAQSVEAVVQGSTLVRRHFLSKLEGPGVTRIEASGQSFDPQLHEAVTTVPTSSPEQDGSFVGIVRHGYRRRRGRQLRPVTRSPSRRRNPDLNASSFPLRLSYAHLRILLQGLRYDSSRPS